MLDDLLAIFALCLLAVFFGGWVSGIVAVIRGNASRRRIIELETRVATLELSRIQGKAAVPSETEREPAPAASKSSPAKVVTPSSADALAKEVAASITGVPPSKQVGDPASPAGPPPLPPIDVRPTPPPPPEKKSIELDLGGKWIGWVGGIMVIIAIGLFLGTIYEKITPEFRLTIGIALGIASIGAGELVLRRNYNALFQSLTGMGIGIFYVCIFFSFRFWEISGATASFGLAILVTLGGIVLAVSHNAPAIAFLAVLGGFLSPVLFSEGGNHPYVLFIYVAILDLVALGAAYYRRWRALDVMSFAGTIIMYLGWYYEHYTEADMLPALLFASLFYLMFLLIPTLYSLSRRQPLSTESLTLIIVNAVYSLFAFYNVLYEDYRFALGFVVLAQAVLVFFLFLAWSRRVRATDRTAESLLIITLSLVTLAIPLELKLYGMPIAWAVEGAVVIYLGLRFDKRICKWGGTAALFLAAGGLLSQLPLHHDRFLPVFNMSFGSWAVTIVAIFVASVLLYRRSDEDDRETRGLAVAAFVLGYVMTCILLTLEVSNYWREYAPDNWRTYRMDSLILLWAFIPALTTAAIRYRNLDPRALILPACAYAFGAFIFLAGFDGRGNESTWLFFNTSFLTHVLFVISALWAAQATRRVAPPVPPNILETIAHVLLVMLTVYEFDRWQSRSEAVSNDFAFALVSAVWALHGLALVWAGLATRMRLRRILGILLFGITVLKVVAFDTRELDDAFRVISFAVSGVLLLAAAAFYQRFSAQFIPDEDNNDDQ
ncbi:MAG: DUF2339 domain-containing protein [Candidatus Hydrogenedentes bacterium]|nr:DUF2339 domain-containing protein [Candidatus Hydrogenedentota bacterium]